MNILAALQSGDELQVVAALNELGSRRAVADAAVVDVLNSLAASPDSNIRQTLAVQIGVYLRLPAMYGTFHRRLDGEEDDPEVLFPLIDGLAALVMHGAGDRDEVSRLFARCVLDETKQQETRAKAYLALMKLWKRMTPRAYLDAPRRLDLLSWDRGFVDALLSETKPAD
jgi:hypothetical protein